MKMRWVVTLVVVGLVIGLPGIILLNGGITAMSGGWTQPVGRAVDFPVGLTTQNSLMPTPSPLPPELVLQLDAEYTLITNVYDRVAPSVVNIEVTARIGNSPAFDFGSGSGFVYDLDGHIVTNSHVVRDAADIFITFMDGYVTEATVVGMDDFSDLAVLSINVDPARLLPVTMGDSEAMRVGQRVIAIGNPFGLESSLTTGVVSALGRTLPSGQLLNSTLDRYSNPSIIQVDAEINPGNSGGPLLNSSGEVIGVNTAIRTETGIFEGVGFAVPASTVLRVVPELIRDGEVVYSWLGISSRDDHTVAEIAEPLGLPVAAGVLINEITPRSPASQAGLRGGNQEVVVFGNSILIGGDIIVAIDDLFIANFDEMISYLVVNTRPGDLIMLTVVREGQTLEIPLTLGVRPN